MKKSNKKGFTLIELLAVIIILGVIMLIAIPSVTQQITNSRKNSYIDTANAYVNAVVVKVNEGSLPMYDTNRLYLIPVGNNDALSCVSLESGGASPFSKYYNYAYVAVHYTGDSYDYWFLGEDKSLQGFAATPTKTLEKASRTLVLSGMKEILKLKNAYSTTDANSNIVAGTGFTTCKASTTCTTSTNPSSSAYTEIVNATDTNGPKEFADVIKALEASDSLTSIQVFGATECRSYFD